MKHSDFCEFMAHYIKGVYGPKHGWDISISTKKRKGSNWSDVDGENKYTMYVYKIEESKQTVVAKSKEYRGSNKNNWPAGQYGVFVSDLTPIIED